MTGADNINKITKRIYLFVVISYTSIQYYHVTERIWFYLGLLFTFFADSNVRKISVTEPSRPR